MIKTTKENRIKNELVRITDRFKDADENKKAIVMPMIQNAAFMKVTLEDLQEIINQEGVTDVYQNGANQHGIKQSATLQSYNSLIKNYTAVIKALTKIVPMEKKRLMPTWQPKEKTAEEFEEEIRRAEERQRQINEEIAKAAEYQRRQREGA